MAQRPLSLLTCLLVPFVILMVGVTFAGVQYAGTRPNLADESGRGPLPPGFSANIRETGKHTVWLHSYTIFDGQVYESRERLPDGAEVLLIEEATGKTVMLTEHLGPKQVRKIGDDAAVAVGSFVPMRQGAVTVQGRGFPRPVVLSVAPERLAENLGALLTVVGTLILSIFLAIVTLIILLHRRKKMIEAKPEM